jgi:hypothetical protein
MGELPEYVDGLPNLCGSEQLVEAAVAASRGQPVVGGRSAVDIAGIDSAFAVALHMHQPLIPASGPDLRTAAIISNLQWMLEHPDLGDNHNAPVLAGVIARLGREDSRFHMEGGSWTNDLSWVRGYDRVLVPMEQASSLFQERVLARGVPTDDPRYRKALFHLLAAETSCYRYWGQGTWTDYGAELSRRTADIITHAF